MVRASVYDKNGLKKGGWSREEDETLSAYIKKHGHSNWRQLPKLAGLARCGKSCRLRWLNHLRPNLKHGNYSREEEEIIIKLHHRLGNKWCLIAEKLPGRTDHEIKNYWHSYLKKFSKNNKKTTSKLKSKQCDSVKENVTNHFVTLESPNSDACKDFHYILESSTQTMSEEESNFLPMSMNKSVIEEESNPPWLTSKAFSGDFWTEIAILEDIYSINEKESSTLTMFEETLVGGNYSTTSINYSKIEEERNPSWLTFEAFNGDFWTEPSIIEDTYSINAIESSTITMSEDTSAEGTYSPTSMNYSIIEEENNPPWLTFEAFDGDFWTEPSILEDTYSINEIESSTVSMSEETSPGSTYSPRSMNYSIIEEEKNPSWLTFDAFTGDFLTEPSILEDTYTINELEFLIQDFYDSSYML